MARQDFINAEELLNRLIEAFHRHDIAVEESAATVKKLQTEYKKLPSDYLKAQKAVLDNHIKQQKSEQELLKVMQQRERLTQTRIRTEKTQLSLDKQKEAQTLKSEKALQREASKLAAAESLYAKIQAKLHQLNLEYRDLAAKKELGLKLTDSEAKRYDFLLQKTEKYRNALGSVNRSMGNYRDNVGNYSSAFNPLQNSINQLTREMPAFANSVQTGFMAISNNLPILFDSIQQAQQEIKMLRMQGEQVPGLFKRLTSSLFGWGTALSVGVTLLTFYGKEMTDFVGSLFETSKAIDAVKESAKQLNEIRVNSLKSITQERVALSNNLEVAKDTTLSYEEREIAAKKVLDQYPYWFKNLNKEAVMNGKVEEAVKGVNDAFLARAKSSAAVDKITENQSKIIDLEEELRAEKALIKGKEERVKAAADYAKVVLTTTTREYGDIAATGRVEAATNSLNQSKRKIASTQEEINQLNELNNRLLGYSVTERKKSIGLDYQETEALKAKQIAFQDFIASQYELIRTRLENEARGAELIANNEELSYEKRKRAADRFYKIQIELADIAFQEEQRLIKNALQEQTVAINQQAREGEITERQKNSAVYALQQEYQFKSALSYENYSETIREANRGLAKSLKGVWENINFQKAQNLIDQRALDYADAYNAKLKELNETNADYRNAQEAAKEFAEANRDITTANIQLDIDKIEKELAGIDDINANVEKRMALEDKLIRKKKELTDVTIKETEEQVAAIEKLQKATENYLQSFRSDALNDFGFKSLSTLLEIQENGKSLFSNLMEGADTMEEKFAVAFNAVTSVAQEAFTFLNQNSQAYFDAEYDRLERNKDLALKYAGDNAEGREEIERQYEQRQREIKRREWEANKEAALFNIAINTAQGITAALASVPPNPILAGIIGGIGIVQAQKVASRQVPAYAEGTDNHPGGLMLVNDANGANYKEVIAHPGGEIIKPKGRNVLMDAPKGTKVYKNYRSFEDELNKQLSYNSIAPFHEVLHRKTSPDTIVIDNSGGITEAAIEKAMINALKAVPVQGINVDENGFRKYSKNLGGIKETLNRTKIRA